MIKFQFKIVVDKKGVKKTFKPFLNKTASSLALILSVVVLSTIIGLGIHLVLASNPTNNPPEGNVPGPVNVSGVAQTKEGELEVLKAAQKNGKWFLDETGKVYSYGNASWFDNELWGKIVIGRELVYADKRLEVGGTIYAPNQNREDEQICNDYSTCKYTTPNTAVITCPAGKFLYKIQINKDGLSSQGWCAAPFVKSTSIPIVGGGGSDHVSDAEGAALAGYEETFDWMSPFFWTWSAY